MLSISNDTIYLTNGGFVRLAWDNVANKPVFSNVAFTNEYGDLSNKPAGVSAFTNDAGYITLSDVPTQQQANWNEADPTAVSYIQNKPTIPTVPENLSEFTNDLGFITAADVEAQVNADWAEADPTSKAYIENKPDLSGFITTADLSNYVTKSEDETIGGDKTFEDAVTMNGDNVVSATGSLEVPSVLDNVASDGTLNLSTSTGTGNCEQTVNFCDLQTVYDNILNKFKALNDEIDDLLDSIKDLNKQLNTPKDGEACPNTPTVTDIDGNTYSTVRIGNQCWTRENLRTTKLPDGTAITSGTISTTGASYYTNPAGGASAVPVQGYLYNFHAATNGVIAGGDNIQGICPVGWRLPSNADWNELKTYVSNQSEYKCSNYSYITKALSSPLYWPSNAGACTPGNNPEANNATGFSMVPAKTLYWADVWSSNVYEWGFDNTSVSFGHWSAGVTSFYSVRCIRSNSNGENNTVNGPTVETIDSIRDITQNTAWILGGKITDNGGMPISRYGVVVGTSASVTIPTATTVSSSTYSISVPYTMGGYNVTGLSTNTAYYYRAFAINAIDTAYGEAIAFHTVEDGQPCPGLATITDINGNTYNTVMIGSQCWLKENLKVTKYADNTAIPKSNQSSNTDPYYTDPLHNDNNGAGYLYNIPAVLGGAAASSANPSGVRGICPVGWHVPSDAEFEALKTYVNGKAEFLCNSTSNNIAKALAAKTGWSSSDVSCSPGKTPSDNNATGFSAIQNTSSYADFWTASKGNYYIQYSSSTFEYYGGPYDSQFYGVRCLKDAATTSSSPKLPTVEISSFEASTDPSYQKRITASVTDDGGASVTYRGIYYSKTHNPSPSNKIGYANFTDGTAGNYVLTTNLEANTTYYVRAAAQNSVGWSYSDEYSFTTDSTGGGGMKCPGTPTVSDKNGYSYNTVQIGSQCWTAQNLRSTTYPGGGSITYKMPNNGSLVNALGRLYAYTDAMNGSVASTTLPVQGICPTGWHLPSPAEFDTLANYLSTKTEYQCNGSAANIAKALAAKIASPAYSYGWTESAVTCAAGNTPSSNNASGFNAYPAGYVYSTTAYKYSEGAVFQTTQSSKRLIEYDHADITSGNYTAAAALSVRCVKGATPPSVKTGDNVTNKTRFSATVEGNLYTDGINTTFNASAVTELGICYSGTNTTPTISDSKKTVAVASGSYTADLTGLSENTKYYYRAYATNANGTQYGEVKNFTTKKGARVYAYAPSSVDSNKATLSAYVYLNGADSVTGFRFWLYKQNNDGTYPSSATTILYTTTIGTFNQSGINFTVNSLPKTGGTYYFYINSGLEPGATYKVCGRIHYMIDGVSGGWTNYTNAADTVVYRTFTTTAKTKVTTGSYTYSGSGTTYTLRGNITRKGNQAYTEKGILLGNSSHPDPKYGDYTEKIICTDNSTGEGEFSCETNRPHTANYTYYYRAYAIQNGTYVYGDVQTFVTPSKPTTSFSTVYYFYSPYYYSQYIKQNSISVRINCSNSGSPILERGLLYTTSSSVAASIPTSLTSSTISQVKSDAGSKWVRVPSSITSSGSATLTIQDSLNPNTTYYVVSYAQTAYGAGFSNEYKTIKTALNCGQTLTDQQGNTYATTKIGTQCWMKSNLKATRYDNTNEFGGVGTALTHRSTGSSGSTTTRYEYYPNGNSGNTNTYGYLYNWAAAVGLSLGTETSLGKTQGICPRGWHIPTTAELTTLRGNISGTTPPANVTNYTNFNPKFAGWINSGGVASDFGSKMYIWSATQSDSEWAWYNYIVGNNVDYGTQTKSCAMSVRCVQD